MVADFHKNKRSPWSKLLAPLLGVAILGMVTALIVADVKIYQKKQKLTQQIENLKNKIEDIKNQNKRLQEGIEQTNDESYIEKVAREDLGLQKPGERVISFVEAEKQPQEAATQKNVLQVWLGSFIGWFK